MLVLASGAVALALARVFTFGRQPIRSLNNQPQQ